MPELPFPFPAGLTMVESAKVNWYYRRYAEDFYREYRIGHFLLAAYAAVPALLTPDLLYKLWQNFSQYTWGREQTSIHRIAVADLLLSPFCREAGYELYEMNHEIRLSFLQWLENERESDYWKSCNLPATDDIARFSEAYHLQSNPGNSRWGITYNDAQTFEAISFYDPAQAARRLFNRIHQLTTSENINETELLNILDLFVRTSQRLKRRTNKDGYEYFRQQAGWMNAWKELLQSNIEGFKQKLTSAPELLDLLNDTSDGGIEVVISKGVVESIKLFAPRKLKALVVGLYYGDNEAYTGQGVPCDWARLFSHTLKDLEGQGESVMITHLDRQTSKGEMIAQWRSIVETSSEEDDLLFYLAGESFGEHGHCLVRCPGDPSVKASYHGREDLADTEIGSIANSSRSASVTMILELDQAGTAFWLDPSKPGNCLFASGRYDNAHSGPRQPIDPRSRGNFTRAVARAMRSYGLKITNRQLFAKALDDYHGLLEQLDINPASANAGFPDLLCHQQCYRQFFLKGKNYLVNLQDALRAAGYLHKDSCGLWDQETSTALKSFTESASLTEPLTKQQYTSLLLEKAEEKTRQQPPLFLVIFADEQNSLLVDARKESGILDALRMIERKAEVKLLWKPDRKAIRDLFTDVANRDRIQLVYMAGSYGAGSVSRSNEQLNIQELASLLPFQQNLKFFFAGMGQSVELAWYATRIGIPLAMANMDDRYYAEEAEFGIALMKSIAAGEPVTRWLGERPGNIVFYRSCNPLNETIPVWDWDNMVEVQRKSAESNRVVSLLVGIDRYTNQTPLKGCVNGMRQMAGLLTLLNQQPRFDTAVVTELSDEEATRQNLISQFNRLFEVARPGDTCLVCFSGHGVNQGYSENLMIPVDYRKEDPGSSISNNVFFTALEKNKQDKLCQTVLILDSHSGYYRWVGDDDIMIGAVRHTYQSEQAFQGQETSSAFMVAFADIISACKGFITYRHLQAWLRFKVAEVLAVRDELPIVMASASNFDQYFLTSDRRNTEDLPLIAFNKTKESWQLVDEDFCKVNIGGQATVRSYVNGQVIDNVSGQFFFDLDRILFGGSVGSLDKSLLYLADPARPALPVYFPAGMTGYGLIRQILDGLRFDRFSYWGSVGLIAENVKEDGHYDEGLYFEEENGGYIFRVLPGRTETELADLNVHTVAADQVKNVLVRFARYHYLFNLENSYPMQTQPDVLSVRLHYRWKKADATGNEFGRRKLKISEEAMRFVGGSIEFNTLEVQIQNEEAFPVYCEVILLLSDLTIQPFPAAVLAPIAPNATVRFEIDEPEVLERILVEGLTGQIRLLSSRDPIQLDFSQITLIKSN